MQTICAIDLSRINRPKIFHDMFGFVLLSYDGMLVCAELSVGGCAHLEIDSQNPLIFSFNVVIDGYILP